MVVLGTVHGQDKIIIIIFFFTPGAVPDATPNRDLCIILGSNLGMLLGE